MFDERELENFCIIVDNKYSLSDIEQLGLDKFVEEAYNNLPQYLYKYFPDTRTWNKADKKYHNYSYEALVNNTVYLQDSINFDDSFDCAIDLDLSKFLRNRLIQYCGYFNIDYPKDGDTDKIIYYLSLGLYNFNSLENTLQNIVDIDDLILKMYIEIFAKTVWVSVFGGMDWGLAIIKAIENEYNDFIDGFSKFKITCFSSSPFLNRMWSSKYANDNKGFCVEYKIEPTEKSLNELGAFLLPVIYSQKRNDALPMSFDSNKVPSDEYLWQMFFNGFLRKSIHWQDQKEWRLIRYNGLIKENPVRFYNINKVYLGNKMSATTRKKIIEYCKSNGISYAGVVRDINSFNLIECKRDCYTCPRTQNEKAGSSPRDF